MFGLSETLAARPPAPGKSKGVVLVKAPRRISWLAGWTHAAAPTAGAAAPKKPAAVPPSANARNRS
jgi:hypothetical protein